MSSPPAERGRRIRSRSNWFSATLTGRSSGSSIAVNEKGDIVWDWLASDRSDEMGFAPDARAVIKAAAAFNKARGSYDWLHVNSATYVGPNQWFDKGDMRFAPNHVIISSREASLIAIVGRDGSIVWRMGPDFSAS